MITIYLITSKVYSPRRGEYSDDDTEAIAQFDELPTFDIDDFFKSYFGALRSELVKSDDMGTFGIDQPFEYCVTFADNSIRYYSILVS